MPTGTHSQLRLMVVDDMTGERVPPPPSPRRVGLNLVARPEPVTAPAWDPHEVWLNRVKKPRDERGA